MPLESLKSGVKKEKDSGFELWHWKGSLMLPSLNFLIFWRQTIMESLLGCKWLEGRDCSLCFLIFFNWFHSWVSSVISPALFVLGTHLNECISLALLSCWNYLLRCRAWKPLAWLFPVYIYFYFSHFRRAPEKEERKIKKGKWWEEGAGG